MAYALRTRAHALLASPAVPWLFGLVSALVCLAGSWHVSLWTDEAVTVLAADRSLPALFRLLATMDAVHAAYYLLMHGWVELFGVSPFALRLPSAIAAGVTTAGTVLLARRISQPATAAFAGVVMLVLPRVTWMGIEARPFALSAAAAVWATYLLVRACTSSSGRTAWRWFAAYAIVAGLGVIVNVYVALVVVAHGVTLLLLRDTSWRTRLLWLSSAVAAAVLASPVVLAGLGQQGQITGVEAGPLGWARNIAVNQWFLGDTPTTPFGGDGTADVAWKLASVALAAGCSALALIGLAASRSRVLGRRLQAWAWPALVVPTLVVAGWSLVGESLYNPRYFTMVSWAVALLVGAGIRALPRQWTRVVALVLVVALAAPVYASQRRADAKSGADWAWAADVVDAEAQAGDGVYFAPRRPDPRAVVIDQTMRRIAESYPDRFDGMTDVTQLTSGAADGSLDGTSRQLRDAGSVLDDLDAVWVIRYRGDPEQAVTADAAVLEAHGFARTARKVGTTTTVERWIREG